MAETAKKYITRQARKSGEIPPFGQRAKLPIWQMAVLGTILIAAAIVALIVIQNLLSSVTNPADSQDRIDSQLTRSVNLNLPSLPQLITMTDDDILTSLTESGDTIYNQAEEGAIGLDIVKLPSDVTLVDAAAYYATGVDNLDASSAAKLLKGSWTMSTTVNGTRSIKVHYADFDSKSLDAAVSNAVAAEFSGDGVTLGDLGTDDSGNTYQSGTIAIDDTTYQWTVSACLLSEVYSVKGFPNTAVYVGVKLSSQ